METICDLQFAYLQEHKSTSPFSIDMTREPTGIRVTPGTVTFSSWAIRTSWKHPVRIMFRKPTQECSWILSRILQICCSYSITTDKQTEHLDQISLKFIAKFTPLDIIWWACSSKHCFVQQGLQMVIVWNIKHEEKLCARLLLWRMELWNVVKFEMTVKCVVDVNFVGVTSVYLWHQSNLGGDRTCPCVLEKHLNVEQCGVRYWYCVTGVNLAFSLPLDTNCRMTRSG